MSTTSETFISAMIVHYLSRVIAFCLCENKDKGADQLYDDSAADQHLCFCYVDCTIPLLPKSKNSGLYPSSVAVQDIFHPMLILCNIRVVKQFLFAASNHFAHCETSFFLHFMLSLGSYFKIRDEKLSWEKSSKVGSLDNVKHVAGGGKIQVRTQACLCHVQDV